MCSRKGAGREMQDVKRIEKEKKYWDKLSPRYDQFMEKYWRIYRSLLLDKISNDVDEGDIVLEVACGTGLVALKLAERVSKVSGIDISAPMIDEAKKKLMEKGSDNVEFFVEDAYSLHFENDLFDTVICNNAMQNMKYPQRALAEIRRVLKPGGRFISATIGFGETPKYKILFTIFKPFIQIPVFHKLDLEEIADMIRDSGFSIVNKEILKDHQDPLPLVYVLAKLSE
jgi:ubiquinone/menaquinone biosynthesis C-methylase UbiE